MSNKRRERNYFPEEQPKLVETGAYKYSIEIIDNICERIPHWAGTNDYCFYSDDEEDPENTPEYTGEVPQSLKLNDILEQLKNSNIDPKDVVISASFADDYLSVEVLHVKEQTLEEQEAEYQCEVAKKQKEISGLKKQRRKELERQQQAIERQLKELK